MLERMEEGERLVHNSTASFLSSFLNERYKPSYDEELKYAPIPEKSQLIVQIFLESERGQIAEKVTVVGIVYKEGKLVVERDGGEWFLSPYDGIRWQLPDTQESHKITDKPGCFPQIFRIFNIH